MTHKNQDLIDFDLINADNSTGFYSIIAWWESRRWIFNVFVIATQLFVMLMLKDATLDYGIANAILGSIAYLIVANLMFCMGWGVELVKHHFLGTGFSRFTCKRLLSFGIVCSILYTLLQYGAALFGTWGEGL